MGIRSKLAAVAAVLWLTPGLVSLLLLARSAPVDRWLFAAPGPGGWLDGVGWTWPLLAAGWLLLARAAGSGRHVAGLLRLETLGWSVPLLPFTLVVGPLWARSLADRPALLVLAPALVWISGALCRRHARHLAPSADVPAAWPLGWRVWSRLIAMGVPLAAVGFVLLAGLGLVPALPGLALAVFARDGLTIDGGALAAFLRAAAPLIGAAGVFLAFVWHALLVALLPGHVLRSCVAGGLQASAVRP